MLLYTYQIVWHCTTELDQNTRMPIHSLSRSTATFVIAPNRQVAVCSMKHWSRHRLKILLVRPRECEYEASAV